MLENTGSLSATKVSFKQTDYGVVKTANSCSCIYYTM